ncbi:MAG TPA: type VII secretion protein EsxS [Mycobacterium sp.]|nr:type VII secretion protein EsxS [Mycobacterium sp.]
MGYLDAQIPQMVASQASFADQAALFQSTVHSAENSALAAQANHQGESAMAFQQAHAHFVEVAQKMNTLLSIAGQNIGEGATSYVVGDSDGANMYQSGMGAVPGALPNIHG